MDSETTQSAFDGVIYDGPASLTSSSSPPPGVGGSSTAGGDATVRPASSLTTLHYPPKGPITGIASFVALIADLNLPFKPRSPQKPWNHLAGAGQTATVEVMRYIPGQHWDGFNYSNYPQGAKLGCRIAGDEKRTGQYYAVKRLSGFSARGAVAQQYNQLCTEMRVLSHKCLREHQNLVYLMGVAHITAEPCLVFEQADFGTLETFFELEDVHMKYMMEIKMGFCQDIARGLDVLHKHGVVHSDIKTRNILVKTSPLHDRQICGTEVDRSILSPADSPFIAKIADFGSSIILDDCQPDIDTVRLKGWTRDYAAPECLKGRPLPKKDLYKIDIYSAGLVFCEILLDGKRIWDAISETEINDNPGRPLQEEQKQELCSLDLMAKVAWSMVRWHLEKVDMIAENGERTTVGCSPAYSLMQNSMFGEIFELCLKLNPERRVTTASAILEPWRRVIADGSYYAFPRHRYGNHPSMYKGIREAALSAPDDKCKCTLPNIDVVARMFPNSKLSPGVFDVPSSFRIFRATLTGKLKEDITKDMKGEVELGNYHGSYVRQMKQRHANHARTKRAAEYAYQLGLAYIEGFGVEPSAETAINLISQAAAWGDVKAQAHSYRAAIALGVGGAMPKLRYLTYSMAYGYQREASESLALLSKDVHTVVFERFRAEFKQRWIGTRSHNGESEDITLQYTGGWTALHYAAFTGPLELVVFQATFGDDIRTLGENNDTALEAACLGGNIEIVDYLLTLHEMLEEPFLKGSCPLQAVQHLPTQYILPAIDRISKLKIPGVTYPLNARNMSKKYQGETALMRIMKTDIPTPANSRFLAMYCLLEMGANPLITRDDSLESPLRYAVIHLEAEILDSMLEAVKRYRMPQPSLTAAFSGSLAELIRVPRSLRLIEGGERYKENMSVILKAAVTRETIERFPLINSAGEEILGWACYYGDFEIVEALERMFSDNLALVFPLTFGKNAPGLVSTSVMNGHTKIIEFLLPRVAHLESLYTRRVLIETVHHNPSLVPLVYSCYEAAGTGLLILSEPDAEGATPLDIALEYGRTTVASFLVAEGTPYDVCRIKPDYRIDKGMCSPLARVIGKKESVEFLLELDPPPSLIVTTSGLNVFHIMASQEAVIADETGRNNFRDLLHLFHDLQPELISAPGSTAGYTPFHIVALHYAQVVGSFLHSKGADVNALDHSGRTPLDLLLDHGNPEAYIYRSEVPQDDEFICDYAFAGPMFWDKEKELSTKMVATFRSWGAKTAAGLEGRQSVMELLQMEFISQKNKYHLRQLTRKITQSVEASIGGLELDDYGYEGEREGGE